MASINKFVKFFLYCRKKAYTIRAKEEFFYGAVLLLTLPAFFTVQFHYLHCPPFLRCSPITYIARLFYGAVLLLTLPAFFTVQYYYLHCVPFLRCSFITYTARLFYGAVLFLTLPAFFTVQYYFLHLSLIHI